jgi:putative pyrroloquinoline-quinone-binding quinoprotein
MLRAYYLMPALALAACQSGAGTGPAVPSAVRAAAARTGLPMSGAVNWPEFRFNDARTGVNPHERVLTRRNVPHMQLLWQAQLGSLVDYSSPAVVNGTVYIASSDGRLWAYPAGRLRSRLVHATALEFRIAGANRRFTDRRKRLRVRRLANVAVIRRG